MKSLNQFIILSLFMFGYSFSPDWKASIPKHTVKSSINMSCPNPCQTVDSLALVALYNATNGPGWTNTWDTSLPVCTPWPGITLDSEGFVTTITLNNFNLSGILPNDIGNFTRLEKLALDNNSLIGTIPESIGNLTELLLCFLDNNQLTGSIPEGFGALTQMNTLYLDNNNLSGTIPDTFLNLNNLFILDIFNNDIDSIPNLSSMNLQSNKFRIFGNNVTFDDIVLNDLVAIGNNYEPQDSVFTAMSLTLPTGVPYTIDLGFDSGISTNIYQWFRNGVPYGGPLTTNKLTFDPIIFASQGEYRCQVTNTLAPLLTLHTRPVTINVICGTSTYEVNDTLCPGDERILNFVTYDENNLTGTEFPLTSDQYGCDSVIIVNLTYHEENIADLNETICQGDTLWVNGTAYHEDNTTGLELLPIPDQFGCDSSLNVNLSFHPNNIFQMDQTICPEDSIIINGTIYNQSNPTGSELLPISGTNGCDSIIEVNLSFFTPPAAGNLSQIICSGDSIEVFGVILNQDNPSTTIMLEGMTINGCDSTLFVEVQFHPPAEGNYTSTICEGDSIILDGEVFDADRTSGQVILEGTAEHGCDSIVNVLINFYPPVQGDFEPTICTGDSIIFNGTVYNQDNQTGVEILPGASSQGCDSTVFVSLSFNSSIVENITQTLCHGDSIIVNGITYNQSNFSGTEMVAGGSVSGCDSTVIIDLSFHPLYEEILNMVLCDGDSIIVNNVTYNAANPTGTEIIENGSTTLCDSTIIIDLSFYPAYNSLIDQMLCSGDSIIVNGVTYNESNPNGTELITNGSSTLCDSTITVNLSFHPLYETDINTTLCEGDSIIVNGVTYNSTNPTGTEVIENGSTTLCDSTIFINLSFNSSITENIIQTLCLGDSVIVNGVTFNESNPNGSEMIPGGSTSGCDSTVVVDLSFHPISENLLNTILCDGDSIIVNGVTYNSTNPTGTEVIENGSVNLCDSTIIIDLSFYPVFSSTISQTLCPGDSIIINGTTYNESNPNGTEIFINGSTTLCDSIVNIMLDFHPEILATFEPIICVEDSLLINGIIYNFDNPTGTEVLENASSTGCDSTVIINLSFHPNDPEIINRTLCPEQGLFINGTAYNESNPSGTEVIENGSVNGCDSTIIITLTYNSNPETLLNPTLCPGDSIVINNVVYNADNPVGIQHFENEAANGCDSIVNIDLSFYPFTPGNFSTTLCPGDSVVINGTTYNFLNNSGSEIIENGSTTGCDSILNVSIAFFDGPIETIIDTLCTGDEIIINDITYNAQNPNGTEVISASSENGCDSVVVVDLFFKPHATLDIFETLCSGDSMIVNGVTYNESNPSGNIILEEMAINGCDSIINIILEFHPIPIGFLNTTICNSDTILVNGNSYHFDNPIGSELIENGASTGCDSIIEINLSFFPLASGSFNPIICAGDSIEYNSIFYHADNLSGTAIFENSSTNGCDSIVQIQVNLYDPAEGIFEQTICMGDTIFVNGVAYHESNLSGTETLENASINGCDSILQVQLNLFDLAEGMFEQTICMGDTIFINGTAYHGNNLSGTEILENASVNGCDSTLQIQLILFEQIEGNFEQTICMSDTILVNGTAYHENNFSGIETLENASSNGCDSTFQVQINFYDAAEGNFNTTICVSDTIEVNGTPYYFGNDNGIETLENASINGCDSTLFVMINFTNAINFDTTATICQGDFFVLAAQTFSETGAYEIILEGASSTGCDSIINLNLNVQTTASLGEANAGDDMIQCDNFVNLNANLPNETTGLWTSLNEMNVSDPHSNTIEVNDLSTGQNTFIWTLSSEYCINYDRDTVSIFVAATPNVNDDIIALDHLTNSVEINLLENDQVSNMDAWTLELMTEPESGLLTEIESGLFSFERTDIRGGELTFEYKICNDDCPDFCSIASVRIILEQQDIDLIDIPNAITPNDDGLNEYFMFPHLEFLPENYPDRELIIFNRWGDIVYQAKPYNNDWHGEDQSGKALPQGTYYYVLRLDINNGVILKGDVSILK